MQNTKLIKLYGTLSEKNRKKLMSLLLSPYHNTNENLPPFLKYIESFYQRYDDEDFTRDNAFRFIFQDNRVPDKSYMIKLSSKLTKLLEQFIFLENTKSNSFLIDYQMLRYYARHGVENEFYNTYRQINKGISKEDVSMESFYNRFVVEQEYNRFVSTRKDKGTGDVHFESTIEALETFFYLNKLIYECQKINRTKIVKNWEDKAVGIIDLDKIEERNYIKIPIIELWFKAYQLLKSQDKELYYHELKEIIINKKITISVSQTRLLFTYLENTAIFLFQDRMAMYQEIFSLYQYQYMNGILLDGSILVPPIIRNFVAVAIKVGEINLAEKFIKEIKEQAYHKDYLEVLNLSEAYVLFEKRNFDEVLDIINVLKVENIYLKLEEKRLRVKSYYELGMDDLNFDTLNTFRVFLTENKNRISEHHLAINRNFIIILNQALKVKNDYSKKEYNIKERLSEISPITDKEWLFLIIDDLII